jgi:23S rRNA (adenine1618-N6)-methyltransferase
MLPQKREHPKEKTQLHPRNKHRERYDFEQLIASCPELAEFVSLNKFDDESIDFFNPNAVKMLNKALLKHFYDISFWDIPKGYLCPPIPGRADYLHYVADLLGVTNNGRIPVGSRVKCLDIGVGSNCVYPIIGVSEYGWSFTGTEIDPVAIDSASRIIEMNPSLKGKVELRLQHNPKDFFRGIIQKDERFDLTICNPPFNSSLAEARSGTVRKLSNLTNKRPNKPILNFGGQSNELCCEGGELRFVDEMVRESKQYSEYCCWFSTLVSKESNLISVYNSLRKADPEDVKTIPMGQGNKISRIVAWTFFSMEKQEEWAKLRWGNSHKPSTF